MKNILLTTAVLAVVVLSGCGDRVGDCENGVGSTKIDYKDPVAFIDVKAQGYTPEPDDDHNQSTLAFRWYSSNDPIIFDANRSKDQDSAGDPGIVSYNWLVKNEDNTTMDDSCISKDINGSRLIVKICDQARDTEFEKFSVKLTVTDNEGKKATDYKLITIY
jgi:hypothetical protein